MARMIPAYVDDNTPPGERDVFQLISNGPDDWTVIHSLDLAPWNRLRRTEIDFLIIVPSVGIACIEVKSQENISFDENGWFPSSITRSPFKQSIDAAKSFYRRLSEIAPRYKSLPVIALCIFPKSRFRVEKNLSIKSWELIDSAVFGAFRTGNELCVDIEKRMKTAIEEDITLKALSQAITNADVDYLIKCCVPVQKRNPSKREEIEKQDKDIERILLAQQKPVIGLANMNQRVVIDGAAGTGKTLIALEIARREALRGNRVGFLCYNRIIGSWLKSKVAGVDYQLPNLIVGPVIQFLLEISGIQIPESVSSEYWENELPDLVEEKLTDPNFRAQACFDYLVVDEAQDILARPRLWDCLCQFLVGGTYNGRYILFGDFNNQVLTDQHQIDNIVSDIFLKSNAAKYSLTENCRNYKIVGDTAVNLSGISENIYSDYLRIGGSQNNYDIYFYQSEDDQLRKINEYIIEFKNKGYRPSEITLLSFRADRFSAATKLREKGLLIRSARDGLNQLNYSSIHAFKGMENKIIILTDVMLNEERLHRNLLYVGQTRSTDSVRILCDDKSKRTLLVWLRGKE